MTEVVTLERQGEIVEEFLEGLLEAFDLDGEVEKVMIDDEMLELQVAGDDLGLLIGPKGQTLTSLQELARTVVQRQSQGSSQGRFRLDVSGYRQRRREALARFATQVAADVQEKGVARALEPMGAADRKVVHDTINDIEGVSTLSEGDEPSRRVVVTPA
jgi:spoIIIJ-associated protein